MLTSIGLDTSHSLLNINWSKLMTRIKTDMKNSCTIVFFLKNNIHENSTICLWWLTYYSVSVLEYKSGNVFIPPNKSCNKPECSHALSGNVLIPFNKTNLSAHAFQVSCTTLCWGVHARMHTYTHIHSHTHTHSHTCTHSHTHTYTQHITEYD